MLSEEERVELERRVTCYTLPFKVVQRAKQVAEVKAIACTLAAEQGLSLSRFSRAELHRLVVERGVSEAAAPR